MTILTARLADKNRNRAGVTDAVLRVSSPALTDAAGRTLYQGGYEDVPFSSDGTVILDLLPTDTPGTNPSAWSYTFQVRYRLDGQRRAMPRFAAQVTGDTIDLATLQPQGTTDPVFVPPVNFQAAYAETLTARDGAVAARAGAEAARDVALAQTFAGTLLGSTVDLNTVTTPGVYRATTSSSAPGTDRNYPAALAGMLFVYQVSGSGNVMQEYVAFGAGARVEWKRVLTGGTFQPWRPFTSTRIDRTAGLAVYTYDEVAGRDQLVHGDTGWRNLSSDVTWDDTRSDSTRSRTLHVRRVGYLVHLLATYSLAAPTASYGFVVGTALPSGFAPGISGEPVRQFHSGGGVPTGGLLQVQTDGRLAGAYLSGWSTSGAYTVSASFLTTQSWPTSLPGVAVGSVPNA